MMSRRSVSSSSSSSITGSGLSSTPRRINAINDDDDSVTSSSRSHDEHNISTQNSDSLTARRTYPADVSDDDARQEMKQAAELAYVTNNQLCSSKKFR